MDEEVIQYIQKTQPWQAEVCSKLRELVIKNVPDVEERLQYGKPQPSGQRARPRKFAGRSSILLHN